jgi:acetoin utilization protein AcuB
MTEPLIEQFMSPCPHTIGQEQPLALGHRIMREHGIRHLPVLHAGKLVGVLSQRDLHFIETLQDVDPDSVEVAEAMSTDSYTVGPKSTVREVAAQMAQHKYGSAVVLEEERVVGIFTTVDGLRALSQLLEQRTEPAR